MKLAVIGTGYVGLVSGVCLAYKGHQVTCVDLRETVVENLNKGIPHIYEIDLEDMLKEVVANKNFRATTNIQEALQENDTVMIAVGTPSENGEIDLGQIKAVATTIGEFIKTTNKYLSVIVKSTVIPTTTDTFVKSILESVSGKKLGQFGLGMNPEFLREGNAIEDFLYADRVVIGSEDETTKNRLAQLYASWNCDKIFVNTRTAEMIKYTNNTVLASLISLNNELANLAGALGNIDYNDVIAGVASDKRWSPILEDGKRITPKIITYFTPGAGFGGSCFPKDVQAIRTQGIKTGLPMLITNGILDVNNNQAVNAISILKSKTGSLAGKNILLLGLAFKPDTDDIRESSAVKILQYLVAEEASVTVHDPIAFENVQKQYDFPAITYTNNWRSHIDASELIIIGTNWDEYKELQQYDATGKLNRKTIFDSKRLFKKDDIQSASYLTIGYTPAIAK